MLFNQGAVEPLEWIIVCVIKGVVLGASKLKRSTLRGWALLEGKRLLKGLLGEEWERKEKKQSRGELH